MPKQVMITTKPLSTSPTILLTDTLGSSTITIAPQQTTSPTNSTLSVSPAQRAFGYNQTTTITFTAKDANGNAIANRQYLLFIFDPNNSAVFSSTQTTNSSGQFTVTVNVQNFTNKMHGNYTVEVREGTTTIKSAILQMSLPAASITVTPNKSTYTRGVDTQITLTLGLKTSANQSCRSIPIYFRIKTPSGSTITPTNASIAQGTVMNDGTSFSIPIDSTNFPSDGTYTIEVADNANFSSAITPAAVPTITQAPSLLSLILPIVIIAGIISIIAPLFKGTRR
jgi:hypothetical protein